MWAGIPQRARVRLQTIALPFNPTTPMSTRKFFAVALIALFTSVWSYAEPEFVGMLSSNGNTYVAVRADAATTPTWVSVGGRVGSYEVVSYNAATETVLLRANGRDIEVRLKTAAVQPTPPMDVLKQLAAGRPELEKLLEDARTLETRLKDTAAELAREEAKAAKGSSHFEGSIKELRRKHQIEESHLNYYVEALTKHARTQVPTSPR
jgi:hypothetical protein